MKLFAIILLAVTLMGCAGIRSVRKADRPWIFIEPPEQSAAKEVFYPWGIGQISGAPLILDRPQDPGRFVFRAIWKRYAPDAPLHVESIVDVLLKRGRYVLSATPGRQSVRFTLYSDIEKRIVWTEEKAFQRLQYLPLDEPNK